MIGQYDDNLPPQLANDSSFNNEKEVLCHNEECVEGKVIDDYGDKVNCKVCNGEGTILI